jgi:hypothetical protein
MKPRIEEATEWLTTLRVWAENRLNAVDEN